MAAEKLAPGRGGGRLDRVGRPLDARRDVVDLPHRSAPRGERRFGRRAYNFGFVGAHSNDLMPVVAELGPEERRGRHRAQLRLPVLQLQVAGAEPVSPDLRPGRLVEAARPRITREPPGARRSPTRRAARDAAISRVWKLYSIRDYLTLRCSGTRLPTAAPPEFTLMAGPRRSGAAVAQADGRAAAPRRAARAVRARAPQREQPLHQLSRSGARRRTGRGRAGGRVGGPGRHAHARQRELWDRAEYERNLAFIRRYVEERGGTFVDYTSALDPATTSSTPTIRWRSGYESSPRSSAPPDFGRS